MNFEVARLNPYGRASSGDLVACWAGLSPSLGKGWRQTIRRFSSQHLGDSRGGRHLESLRSHLRLERARFGTSPTRLSGASTSTKTLGRGTCPRAIDFLYMFASDDTNKHNLTRTVRNAMRPAAQISASCFSMPRHLTTASGSGTCPSTRTSLTGLTLRVSSMETSVAETWGRAPTSPVPGCAVFQSEH